MPHAITVFEFGYLAVGYEDKSCRDIPQAAFDYLESLCLQQPDETGDDEFKPVPFLRLCSRAGFKAIQVKNHAGVIHTPDGTQVEVLPKLGKAVDGDSAQIARGALLNMLCHLRGFRHIETTDAQIAARRLPLFEVFIRQFLASVNHVMKRGLRSDYVQREDNLLYLKGKLLASQQLKHNLVQQHRFYSQYDEYLVDRPVNRLLHSALAKVMGYAQTQANQRLCRELLFAFNEVPLSRDVKADFGSMRLDRGMSYYESALAWARLILEGMSPLSMQGKANAMSLLFPMELVFEDYVADMLRRQMADGYSLKAQGQSKTLVEHGKQSWFRLKPDLMIMHGRNRVSVMDTKWKLLDASKNNGTDKYGLSQADFYQMFAYAKKYLPEGGDLFLIYPRTDQFNEAIELPFEFGGEHRLWIVPFDVREQHPVPFSNLVPLQSDCSFIKDHVANYR